MTVINLIAEDGHIKSLASVEEELIRAALVRYRGNVSKAAIHLKMTRTRLYRMMAEHGVEIQKTVQPRRVIKHIV